MDTPELVLALYLVVAATAVALYAIHQATRRVELQGDRDRQLAVLARDQQAGLQQVIDKLLGALTDPAAPPAPTPVHTSELAGQAFDAVREFHDGFGGDVVDTPDWTDPMFPDARGDEPRVASVRPGDSVIPGQGNWEQMVGEGRAVVGDEMVGGDEQWEGEKWEG